MQRTVATKPQTIQKSAEEKSAVSRSQLPAIEPRAETGIPLFLQGMVLSPLAPAMLQRQPIGEEKEEEVLQPKLTIGAPGDGYEQEADRVADTVMRMPVAGTAISIEEKPDDPAAPAKPLQTKPISPYHLHRLRNQGGKRLKTLPKAIAPPSIQTKRDNVSVPKVSASIAKTIQRQTGGSPLTKEIRSKTEPLLKSDLSQVRVHSDNNANVAAQNLNAKAFTHRNDIFLGSGQIPTDIGLMAHEATHVVQQRNSSPESIPRA